ncbi:MAG: enoyl-CoA hydratase/isomerase family protein [Bacteroidales bacterium]|nr:enoyl-CoA hydratase/isomerase family protein [Bacteroidales bacterium]MCF8351073.1 enoyl-CoA hydratase/isomerase family protein [Bacteroidales bacterium]MCF8377387.1 enoyl-CoA hydratase/isomerase family protein [Bacteroidales bacterium]MCF8401334.1 enoyl-CoA hydratase/isomerase family protein [Bacteroidales bacterium]
MDYEILKIELTGDIALVTISRPKALNALNTRFFEEMAAAIKEVSEKQDVKVMIITGEGKAFVAGADIAEMVDKDQQQGTEFSKMGQKVFSSLEKMEIPVIAAINGFALGGGLELAMGCDFRIASSKAKFGQPEVNLGMIPGYAATQRLPRLVGLGDALYLLLTADMINAQEALRIGLVQKVVEPEELMDKVMEIAKTIASKGPKAIRKVKYVSRQGMLSDFDSGSSLESEEFGSLFKNEGEEGMRAFLEKRKPNW